MKKRGPTKIPDDHKKLNIFKVMGHLTPRQLDVLDFSDLDQIRAIMIAEGYDKVNVSASLQSIADRVLIDKLNKVQDAEDN